MQKKGVALNSKQRNIQRKEEGKKEEEIPKLGKELLRLPCLSLC